MKRPIDDHSTAVANAPCPRRRQRRDKLRPDTMTRAPASLSSVAPRPFPTTPLTSISIRHRCPWSTCSLWSRTQTCPRHFYGPPTPHIIGCSRRLSINPIVPKPLSFPEQSYPGRWPRYGMKGKGLLGTKQIRDESIRDRWR